MSDVFANNDDEAIAEVQAFLDRDWTFTILADGPGTAVSTGIAYLNLCVNQPIAVSIDDLDEIVAVDEDGNDVEEE